MLDKIIKPLMLAVSLLFCLTGSVLATDVVELNQLVENAEAMDGQTVTVTGEAIGEAMERGVSRADRRTRGLHHGSRLPNGLLRQPPLIQQRPLQFLSHRHRFKQVRIARRDLRARGGHSGILGISNRPWKLYGD